MITMLDKVIRVIVFLLITRCDNDGHSLPISLLTIATMTNALKAGCNPAPEEEKLQRINELIKAYEAIVDGNYIDNFIKAQQEEKRGYRGKSQ